MLSQELQQELDSLSTKDQEKIDQRYQELREEYLSLQEIRIHRKFTQKDLASLLGIEQANVSRTERRKDLKISTLSEYIEALGGELQINAVFPEQIVHIK
ncbi:MAG: transcriptional regulator [Gammaproteobacteria bacterium]|nr:transcriptional regulator [Gammaproteobacteria bacterium]MBK82294.1 transcriptional regulator [Gammaproteobacteria bacterium]MBK83753.1 transcriptional regulator [Gammaproteobacteria bacterium]HCV02080.1 transcriptional regulator [Pseudoalteromonas sp.]|tara:strand:+ start:448 stop:747 length:300 start_codon:yes stop_codon:yes gene_type:complete